MKNVDIFRCAYFSDKLADGAIVVERDYVHPERAIAVQLMSIVRYGRQDDEVMGLNLSKEICLASVAVNRDAPPKNLTPLQVTRRASEPWSQTLTRWFTGELTCDLWRFMFPISFRMATQHWIQHVYPAAGEKHRRSLWN